MKTAREIMRTGVTCIGEHQTLAAAAQHMAELGIGALPITGGRRTRVRHAHRPRYRGEMPCYWQ